MLNKQFPDFSIAVVTNISPESQVKAVFARGPGLTNAYKYAFDILRAGLCGGLSEDDFPREGSMKKYCCSCWQEYDDVCKAVAHAQRVEIRFSLWSLDHLRMQLFFLGSEGQKFYVDSSFDIESGEVSGLGCGRNRKW